VRQACSESLGGGGGKARQQGSRKWRRGDGERCELGGKGGKKNLREGEPDLKMFAKGERGHCGTNTHVGAEALKQGKT